jgi:hypothetical protein
MRLYLAFYCVADLVMSQPRGSPQKLVANLRTRFLTYGINYFCSLSSAKNRLKRRKVESITYGGPILHPSEACARPPNVHPPLRRRDFLIAHHSSLTCTPPASSRLFGAGLAAGTRCTAGAPISVVATASPRFVARVESYLSLTTSPPACRWRSDEW